MKNKRTQYYTADGDMTLIADGNLFQKRKPTSSEIVGVDIDTSKSYTVLIKPNKIPAKVKRHLTSEMTDANPEKCIYLLSGALLNYGMEQIAQLQCVDTSTYDPNKKVILLLSKKDSGKLWDSIKLEDSRLQDIFDLSDRELIMPDSYPTL